MAAVDRVALHNAGNIIILNGASSSGKTSLGQALQSRLPQPYQHLQLDAFRSMEPSGYWDDWKTQPQKAVARKVAALCRAMNAALSEYSRHGQCIIFDTALSNPDSWRYVLEDLVGLPVYLVGVTCSVEELSRREEIRGDREVGLAARQSEWIHTNKEYDLLVDTTASNPDHCAAEIAGWLNNNPVPHAFNTMRARLGVA